MTDITIPPEALEAAVKAYFACKKDSYEGWIEDACLAMLREWRTDTHTMTVGAAFDEVGGTYRAIILPLPKES